MAQLYLVRHGQASFGQPQYDQLSDLGYQQATWLGHYFVERGLLFDHVISGDLNRQQQTAEAIVSAGQTRAQRWIEPAFNEYPLGALRDHYGQRYPELRVLAAPSDLITQLPRVLKWWAEDTNPLLPETWAHFQQRLASGLQRLQANCEGRVLVVSSAGAIATLLSQILGLNLEALTHLNLSIQNTSVSRCFFDANQCFAEQINWTPHLDQPERLASQTFI